MSFFARHGADLISKRRGIGSEVAIRTFKLGFTNRTLGYRLPEMELVDRAALRVAASAR